MDLQTRLQIIQLYYGNASSPCLTLRAYNKANSLKHSTITLKSITALVKKFEKTYSLHDKPRSGRPSLMEERAGVVQQSLETLQTANAYGHASSAHVANVTNIPVRSVRRILKEHIGLYPYHLRINQAITANDKITRLEFVEWLSANAALLDKIVWSDEAYFTLDGQVNTHNCVIWGFEKPQATISKQLHSPKVCVWMGFSAEFLLKPHFFDATINAENYLSLLRDQVFPEMRRRRKLRQAIFQQDGAPPHWAIVVRNFLAANLPGDRIIARGIGQAWPPRSPDLSPLDYWFWGMLKARIYHSYKPTTIDALKQRIEFEISRITVAEVSNAVNNLYRRIDLVREQNGGTFENLL